MCLNTQPMTEALQNYPLHVVLLLLEKAFSKSGYGYVEIRRRNPGEKARDGGHDMLMLGSLGESETRVVVKVVRDSLRQRHADEFSGVIQRTKADFGFLICPKKASFKFLESLRTYGQRIDTLAGNDLVVFLYALGVGMRKNGEPDYAYLETLAERVPFVDHFMKVMRRI
ncbi:MAG: hypothetical protein JST12_13130 [Armatimonadetes bacterium]|nr:hypothetical protein [Armatimonadota bacterium]